MTNQIPPAFSRRCIIAGAAIALALPARVLAQVAEKNEAKTMMIKCSFADQSFTVTLGDTAAAREFAAMLPADLSIEDYATNEKIAYLPRKLVDDGSTPFGNERAGDLCYYAPWGNLAFFHAGYRWSQGLVRLGRLDGGVEPLLKRGKFPLRIELTG